MSREIRLVARLREYGLTVVEVDGWPTRGNETFAPKGVVCHHTAGASTGELPSLRVLINGRSDLPGPLCHVGLARSGACYVIAAGRANHAGSGGWRGLSGNVALFGIEAENDGRQPWPATQLDAYHRLAAALISLTPARDPEMVCGHKEWAPRRKPDPHSIDMDAFRNRVRLLLAGHNLAGVNGHQEDEAVNIAPGETRPLVVVGKTELLLSTDTLGSDAPDVPCRVAIFAGAWNVLDGDQKVKVRNGPHHRLPLPPNASTASVRNDGKSIVDVVAR